MSGSRWIIGLCGYARSGKDTICRALGQDWQRAAFADALKADLAPALSVLPPHTKEDIRPLLVEYGRIARKLDPDWWLKRIKLPPTGNVCITDVRYANEVRWIMGLGGWLFYVHRDGIRPANEEESWSFDEITAKYGGHLYPIPNNTDPEDAAARIKDRLTTVLSLMIR